MGKYILKRLVISIITLLAIATAAFFLIHLIPGNPFQSSRLITDEMLANMMSYYGLDQPLWKQYLTYMGNLLQGDFGYSLKYTGTSVNDIIASTFPVSMQLGLQAWALAFPLGVLFGIISAHRQGKPVDYLLVGISVLGVSVPVFVVASMFQYIFAVILGWFPVARWLGFRYTILPTIALSFSIMAGRTRTMRTLTLEIINEDYIKTAKAKGLSRPAIIFRHELRNALIPMVPTLGVELAGLLMGSFVVEQIFAIPGIGNYFVTSIQNLDYTMTLGLTVFFGVLVVGANFLFDVLYCLLDPRVKITD